MEKDSLRGLAAPGSAFPWKLRLSSIGSVTALHGIAPVQSPACSHCSLSRDTASAFLATVLHVPFPPQPHPSPVLRNFLCAPLSISSLLGRGLGNVQAVLVTSLLPRRQSLPVGPVGIPSIRPHRTSLGLLIGTPCYLWAAGRSPASCQAQVLGEEGGVLVASECPWQELSQPMQRRVTPCNTIFAHLAPGFLPLSPSTLVFFALKTKHIPPKMATEPLWSQWPLIDCELGCARTVQSIVFQCLSS